MSIWLRRLGCGSVLERSWVTGWLEVAVGLNCAMTFSGSPAAAIQTGRYPYFCVSATFPVLVP